MKLRKRRARLQRRIKGYEESLKNNQPSYARSVRRPGSYKK